MRVFSTAMVENIPVFGISTGHTFPPVCCQPRVPLELERHGGGEMWTLLPFQKPHTCPLAPLSWQCLVLRAVLQTQLHQGTVVHAGSPASPGTTLVQDFGSSWPHLPELFLTSPQRLLSLLPSQPARNMALSSMFRAGQVQESSSRPSHRVVSGPVSCCSSS